MDAEPEVPVDAGRAGEIFSAADSPTGPILEATTEPTPSQTSTFIIEQPSMTAQCLSVLAYPAQHPGEQQLWRPGCWSSFIAADGVVHAAVVVYLRHARSASYLPAWLSRTRRG